MTEPRRSRWFVDIWDPEDEAVARMRDALAPRPVEAPGRPNTAELAPDTAPPPERPSLESQERRGRIQALVARLKAGDLSARQLLEDLLG